MMDLHFFADEAGNTGSNYLDAEQPYYLLAGIVLHPEHVEPSRAVVLDVLKTTQAPELSARRLLRRPERAIPLMTQIIRALGKVGAVPAASLIEKRFALGARVADVFLDFAYNPAVTPAFRASGLARSAALVFSELSPSTLAVANRMIMEPSDAVARECCNAVVMELEAGGKLWLADCVRGALEADDLSPASNDMARSGLSPNLAAFMNVMAKLQMLAEAMGARIHVMHDEQVHFEETYRYYLHFAADPASQVHLRALGPEAVMPALSHIAEPTFVTSRDEPLVQAADLLAGSMRHLLRRLDQPEPWTKAEWQLATIALGGFVVDETQILNHFLGGDALLGRLLNGIYGGMRTHGPLSAD